MRWYPEDNPIEEVIEDATQKIIEDKTGIEIPDGLIDFTPFSPERPKVIYK